MEEEYYNTQSLASGGGTIPQRFFYGVGLGTCTIALVWFYNNCYPVTTERLLTDAALTWCRAEVYSQRALKVIGTILAPFTNLLRSDNPEVDLFLHSENGNIIETTYQEFLNKSVDLNFPYIEYYIRNDSGDSCFRIYRSSQDLLAPEGNMCRSSQFSALSVAVCYEDTEKPINMKDCNYYIAGNVLFDRDFLEKTLEIKDLPDNYTVSIIDNSVNTITLHHNHTKNDGLMLTEKGYSIINFNNESENIDEDVDSTEEDCISTTSSGIFGWFIKPKEA